MAIYHTKEFKFMVDVSGTMTAVPGIVDATINLNIETVDVTEVGSLDRAFISGIRTATASGNLFFDRGNSAVAALEAKVKDGAAVAVDFILYGTGGNAKGYSADAIVTSWAPSIAIADVVRVAFSLQITGEVTNI